MHMTFFFFFLAYPSSTILQLPADECDTIFGDELIRSFQPGTSDTGLSFKPPTGRRITTHVLILYSAKVLAPD